MISISNVIIESLKNTPLLGSNIGNTPIFNRDFLGDINQSTILNLNQKLGHLYEEAFLNIIDSSIDLECITHNFQIFDENKQTLGELDYVIYNQASQSYIHLELAVKFYLAKETEQGWFYPGPDARDNWHRKLERMKSHQFMLPQSKEAKKVLKNKFDIDEIETQQLIYGCLFLPINTNENPYPEGVDEKCRIGRWLYTWQWNDYFTQGEKIYLIPKALWPVEVCNDNLHLYKRVSVSDLKELSKERCTMFFLESSYSPKFLVPDNW